MGTSYDELNIDLSIRKFLWSILTEALNIPITGAVTTDDIQRDRWCYYYISTRDGTMGDPRIFTDLTYHIRAKHSAVQNDTDGKWVREIGEYVRTTILEADYRLWNEGNFPLFDFKAKIQPLDLELFRQSGDFAHIASYLQDNDLPQICTFWLHDWSKGVTENMEYEGVNVFDFGRNLTLLHYAPDVIRNQ